MPSTTARLGRKGCSCSWEVGSPQDEHMWQEGPVCYATHVGNQEVRAIATGRGCSQDSCWPKAPSLQNNPQDSAPSQASLFPDKRAPLRKPMQGPSCKQSPAADLKAAESQLQTCSSPRPSEQHALLAHWHRAFSPLPGMELSPEGPTVFAKLGPGPATTVSSLLHDKG